MTNAEYFNQVTGTQEEAHIQAFKSIIAELGDDYPDLDTGMYLVKYRAMIDWLNSEKPVNTKEVNR